MRVSVADAKNKLPELIQAVENGESVTICRRGVAVVDIVRTKKGVSEEEGARDTQGENSGYRIRLVETHVGGPTTLVSAISSFIAAVKLISNKGSANDRSGFRLQERGSQGNRLKTVFPSCG